MYEQQVNFITTNELPHRVRILIIGGGIHGVGVLHDMASRGWHDVLLVEKNKIGSATSRSSTKLLHGGLRYLKNIFDYKLVYEGLQERKLLLSLLPDITRPIELLFPITHRGGMPSWIARSGLILYDTLAGKQNLEKHKKINLKEAVHKIPPLDISNIKSIYSFWDGQTDDLYLTRRVAEAGLSLGASLVEHTKVISIRQEKEGWSVELKREGKEVQRISCRYIVNAGGPWANTILENSNLQPHFLGINIKGSHLLLPDLGLSAGIFLRSPQDKREMFLLPWHGKTLVGTTELLYNDNLEDVRISEKEVNYIIQAVNYYLKDKIHYSSIETMFSGLRWLAHDPARGLHDLSRGHSISQHVVDKGVMFTLYGGKLTSYRVLSRELGDMICRDFGSESKSKTHLSEAWPKVSKQSCLTVPVEDVYSRFSG